MTTDVAIIGLGSIGMGYDLETDNPDVVYSHCRAFAIHPAYDIVAGVDVDEGNRRRFSRAYGRPAFAEVGDMLRNNRPQLVVIAVPTAQHHRVLAEVVALAKPSVVLCEKPLSYDPGQARAMVRLCAEHGIALFVNYMRRATPGVIEVRRRLDAGLIAGPLRGVAWYSKGFLHNGSHFFNLLEYWLGVPRGAQMLDPGVRGDGPDSDCEVRVDFARGSVVFLPVGSEEYGHHSIDLMCRNGRLRYERAGQRIRWEGVVADERFAGHKALAAPAEVIESGLERYQWHVADQLAAFAAGAAPSLCTGQEALATLETMTEFAAKEIKG